MQRQDEVLRWPLLPPDTRWREAKPPFVLGVQEEEKLLEVPAPEHPAPLLLEPLLPRVDDAVEVPLERQLPLVRRHPRVAQCAHTEEHAQSLPVQALPVWRP